MIPSLPSAPVSSPTQSPTQSPAQSPPTQSPTPSSRWTAYLLLCIALLAVSFAPIFIRWSEEEIGAYGTVLNRFLVFLTVFGGGQVLTRLFWHSPVLPSSPKPSFGLLILTGIMATISIALWAIGLQHTTVAKCMLLNNLTPIFTSLGSWLVFRKTFSPRFIVGLIIALGGAMSLGGMDLLQDTGHLQGDIYALLSAVFLGIYFLLVEFLRPHYGATTILLWRCGVGAILLFPLALWYEGQVFPVTLPAVGAVLGLGLVSEGLGQRLLAQSMESFSASFISLFLLLEPIVSALLAWVIFQEMLSPITFLGFTLILSGLYLAQSSRPQPLVLDPV